MNRFITSPWLQIFTGLVLLLTGVYEAVEKMEEGTIGSHHGIIILGIVQVIQSLHMFLERLHQGREKLHK